MDRFDLIKKRTGELLVELIERNHLSNQKLGEIMKCGRNTIDNYRNGKTIPKLEFITRLALKFGVNVEWLYHGRGRRYVGDGLGPIERIHGAGSHDRTSDAPERKQRATPGEEEAGTKLPDEHDSPADDRNIAAMEKVLRILRSKTAFSYSLAVWIDHLDRAVRIEKALEELPEERKQVRDAKDAITRETR